MWDYFVYDAELDKSELGKREEKQDKILEDTRYPKNHKDKSKY